MKNAYFYDRCVVAVAALCCWVMQPFVSAAVLTAIHTQTDSNGYFVFSLVHADTCYRVGGSSNAVSVWLPAPALIGVIETPGWTWSTTAYDGIVWRYTGHERYMIEGTNVSFAYTSAWQGVVTYAELPRTSAWPAARLTGWLYETNHVRATQLPRGEDEAWAAAIPCIEYVTVLGPSVPESAGRVVSILLLSWHCVQRAHARGRSI